VRNGGRILLNAAEYILDAFGRNAMMEFSGDPRRPDPARLFAPLTKRSIMLMGK